MLAVIKKKHNSYKTLREMCLFGKKFSAEEALESGMIDGISSSKTILAEVK